MDPQTAAALERLRAVQPLLEAVERDIAAAEAGAVPRRACVSGWTS